MLKKFLKNIGIFVLVLIILAYPIDFLISKALTYTHDSTGESEVLKDLHNGLDADIAIYGSSRAAEHFDVKQLESELKVSAYNFGIKGNRFIMQYLRHLKYFAHAKHKPKLIILSLDVFSLKALEEDNGIYNKERLLPYMLWDNEVQKYGDLYSANTFEDLDYKLPLYRYHGSGNAFLRFYTLFNSNVRFKGYVGKDEKWKKKKIEKHAEEIFKDYELDKNSIVIFEIFLKEMKDEGIPVLLVYSPEHISGQKLVKHRKEIMTYYSQVANRYNLHFFDYSNAEICKDTTYFHNASHLNLQGVDKFMEMFISDLKKDSVFNSKFEN